MVQILGLLKTTLGSCEVCSLRRREICGVYTLFSPLGVNGPSATYASKGY